jgi:hypothetical protein
VAGKRGGGVSLSGDSARGKRVEGNFIGTDATARFGITTRAFGVDAYGVRSCVSHQSVLHGRQRCDSGAIPQAHLTRDGAQGMAAFAVCSRNAFIAAAARVLTQLKLIERLASLTPPPRRHRHR